MVEISFPTFRDGRGYSAARILREAGFEGELRAAGDVLVDQIPPMRRCGFDSFAPEKPVDAATLTKLLALYPSPTKRPPMRACRCGSCAMAERALDRIDVRPAYTAEDAAAYEARFAGVPAPEMLRTLLTGELHGQIAAVSSFGTESAVLLHMVASADPATPVVFTDTLKMFPETLAYRDTLVERLGLLDVRVIQPDPALLAAKTRRASVTATTPMAAATCAGRAAGAGPRPVRGVDFGP